MKKDIRKLSDLEQLAWQKEIIKGELEENETKVANNTGYRKIYRRRNFKRVYTL